MLYTKNQNTDLFKSNSINNKLQIIPRSTSIPHSSNSELEYLIKKSDHSIENKSKNVESQHQHTPRKNYLNRSSIIKISPKATIDQKKYNPNKKKNIKFSIYNIYDEMNEYSEDYNNSSNDIKNINNYNNFFNDKEKAYKYYIDSAFNGDLKSQKAAARCCMFGIGTDKNYRKACQFLKAAAHQKDIESMVTLAEGYGSGMFPLQEELSDEDDYFDEEDMSSESESSIKFSSSSSLSSDESYISDDFDFNDEKDFDSDIYLNKSSNQLVPNLEKPLSKTNTQVLISPNKRNLSFLQSSKNILMSPTKLSNDKISSKPNIKKIYRKKKSLLNTFHGINSTNIQKTNVTMKSTIREKRRNKYLNKKRKISFHYRKMAAKYGHLSSIKYIAKAYDYGLEEMKITHNNHLAQKYYTIAAKEYEDVESLRRLGDMYYYHNDNKINNKYKEISFNYYQKAALLGDLKASAKVAHCLYYGEGVPQNVQNAYKFLLDIAEKNNDGQLMKYIGDEYFYGTDSSVLVSSNQKKSKELKNTNV
eukprot:jgi/Orpsp1_1/1188401/evm.model.d7180000064491.1